MRIDKNVAYFNWNDPEDRASGIADGTIWRCPPEAQQLAVDDLVSGRVPMNDKVPPDIAASIRAMPKAGA
jgi:hypothetical protein